MKQTEGVPLGVFEKTQYTELTVKTCPGDRIFLYTDGIIERKNREGNMLELDGLQKIIAEIDHEKTLLSDALDLIIEKIDTYSAEIPSGDDMVLLGVEVL